MTTVLVSRAFANQLLNAKKEAKQVFPTSKVLSGSEDHEDASADWHINSHVMERAIDEVLAAPGSKFVEEKPTTAQVTARYRGIIRETMLTRLQMNAQSASAVADMVERSAFHVLRARELKKADHQQFDMEYQKYFSEQQKLDSSRQNWHLKTQVAEILDQVNERARVEKRLSFNPVLACHDLDEKHVYVDKNLPDSYLQKDGTSVPVMRFLILHEMIEAALMNGLRLKYQEAHQISERVERAAVQASGYNWEEYDAFMQKHIARVAKVNLQIAKRIDFKNQITRDASGRVTNMNDLIRMYEEAFEQDIQNAQQKNPALLSKVLATHLIPPGMNADPLKIYADQLPEENDTSDTDIAIYAWTKAAQQLYPRYQHLLIQTPTAYSRLNRVFIDDESTDVTVDEMCDSAFGMRSPR